LDDGALVADVEMRQRLIHQQEVWVADQRLS
jgi:hypothetical protein